MNTGRPCRVAGCSKPASSDRSTLCEAHKRRQRRHGDPEQRTIGAALLRPYRQQASRLLQTHANPEKLYEALRAIHRSLLSNARASLKEYESGRAMNRHHVLVCRTLVDVLDKRSAAEVAELLAAFFLLWHGEPKRFASDAGFTFQVARQFRALADSHVGEYFDPGTQRVKRVYRDFPAQASEFLGQTLVEAYSRLGSQVIAAADRRDPETLRAKIDAAFNS